MHHFWHSADPPLSRIQYGTVQIYAVTDVNTVIAVNDANTVNEESNDIGDSDLTIDMDEIYDVMRKSSPTIGNQLKIESSDINKFSDIQKVLTNHSRGSAYMRFFIAGFVACQKASSRI